MGSGAIVAAQSGIAGSTIIGENVIMGGQSGIAGHLIIGKNVNLSAVQRAYGHLSSLNNYERCIAATKAQKCKGRHLL